MDYRDELMQAGHLGQQSAKSPQVGLGVDTELMRRTAKRLVEGIMTGHDWPNTQKELDRLQAAELLRKAATALESFRTSSE